MKKENIIDLAIQSWLAVIVGWVALLFGGASCIGGALAALKMIPYASLPVGITGIMGGFVLVITGIRTLFSPLRYRRWLAHLILIWIALVFLWHVWTFRGSYNLALIIYFVLFSGITFLTVSLPEALLWHGILFGIEVVVFQTVGVSKIIPTGIFALEGILALIFGIFSFLLVTSRNIVVRRLYFHPLTGLANRNYLVDLLQQKELFWLMILNIQNFKEFNDFLGYKVGDRILSEIATRLKMVSQKYRGIVLAHLHSDEFAVAGMELWSRESLEELCEEILARLTEKPISLPSLPPIRLTFHVGVSEAKENLLGTADMAFRYAVAKGEMYAFYDDSMYIEKSYENNIRATLLLQDALENNRIVPFFQPIVNIETGRIEKYECLVRIVDRNGKVYEPKFFLSVAQRNQLYTEVTKTMIKKCFEIFSKLDSDFSINLSYQDLTSEDCLSTIFFYLAQYPHTATRCIFEIVEETAIQDFLVVENFIKKAKQYGARMALDDFGSGYSNFEYLVKLPFDYIKIDGTLIERLPDDPRYQAVVENIVNFSKKIGSKTVAEYVSSEKIHKHIKNSQIHYGQGFYYGKPEQNPPSPKDRSFD